MLKQINLRGGMFGQGWILSSGVVVPFEIKEGQPVRWLKTSYAKRGDKLKFMDQDFYVQQIFIERAS